MISNVIRNDQVESLKSFLEKNINKKLYKEQQQEISDLIINELTTIHRNVDNKTKLLKPSTLKMLVEDELDLPFCVGKPQREEKRVEGNRITKSYIVITKKDNT